MAYLIIKTNKIQQKGECDMKETIHTKNSFKSSDIEQLKKTVTEKIEKLANIRMKKAV